MPSSINGIGTSFCGYAAPIRWAKPGWMGGGREDHDAVECIVVLFLPLIPMKAVHTFNWSGTQCRIISLKSHGALLAAAMLRNWLMAVFVPATLAIVVCGLAFFMTFSATPRPPSAMSRSSAAIGLAIGSAAFTGALFTWRWLASLHRRSRDLRLVIGPHPLGSSDPATWRQDVLDSVLNDAPTVDPRELITVGQQSLTAGNAPMAMWHARLAAALGDAGGETLTDEILRHPDVVRKLDAFRKKPWLRGEHFPPSR